MSRESPSRILYRSQRQELVPSSRCGLHAEATWMFSGLLQRSSVMSANKKQNKSTCHEVHSKRKKVQLGRVGSVLLLTHAVRSIVLRWNAQRPLTASPFGPETWHDGLILSYSGSRLRSPALTWTESGQRFEIRLIPCLNWFGAVRATSLAIVPG